MFKTYLGAFAAFALTLFAQAAAAATPSMSWLDQCADRARMDFVWPSGRRGATEEEATRIPVGTKTLINGIPMEFSSGANFWKLCRQSYSNATPIAAASTSRPQTSAKPVQKPVVVKAPPVMKETPAVKTATVPVAPIAQPTAAVLPQQPAMAPPIAATSPPALPQKEVVIVPPVKAKAPVAPSAPTPVSADNGFSLGTVVESIASWWFESSKWMRFAIVGVGVILFSLLAFYTTFMLWPQKELSETEQATRRKAVEDIKSQSAPPPRFQQPWDEREEAEPNLDGPAVAFVVETRRGPMSAGVQARMNHHNAQRAMSANRRPRP